MRYFLFAGLFFLTITGLSQTDIKSISIGLEPEDCYKNLPIYNKNSDTTKLHIVFRNYFFNDVLKLIIDDSTVYQNSISTIENGLGIAKHFSFEKKYSLIQLQINNSPIISFPVRQNYSYVFVDLNNVCGKLKICYSFYMPYLE